MTKKIKCKEMEKEIVAFYRADVKNKANSLDKEMFEAIKQGEPLEKIQEFLDKGANPNACIYGRTYGRFMWEAVERGKDEGYLISVFDALISGGANISAGDSDFPRENTPLCAAVLNKKYNLAKFLVEKGADVNCDFDDQTDEALFHNVVWNAPVELVELFIKHGADVNYANCRSGETPLMWASTAERAELLIKAGANIYAKDKNGKTAFDIWKKLYDEGEIKDDALIKLAEKYQTRRQIEQRKAGLKKIRMMRKNIERVHPEEKVSGVPLADEIAGDVISGKEKRKITPEIGAEIRRRKAFESTK